jgi:hypothetical protein
MHIYWQALGRKSNTSVRGWRNHPAEVMTINYDLGGLGAGLAERPGHDQSQLFPKDQAAAVAAYLNAIQQYPGSYQVSAATLHSQYLAGQQWPAGQDAAGPLVGDIRRSWPSPWRRC